MTRPSKWRVLRVHTRETTHSEVYEVYDSQTHTIYFVYYPLGTVIDGVHLRPTTSVGEYLHHTGEQYM